MVRRQRTWDVVKVWNPLSGRLVPLLETVAVALSLYRLLPRPLREAAEKTAEIWIDEALRTVGVEALKRLRGTDERKAIAHALSKAVALTLARHPHLDAVAFTSDFRRPPFSDEVTRILTHPKDELQADRVHDAFRDSPYELKDLGLDEFELLKEIRTTFLALLRRDERTRSLWSATVLERVSQDVAAMRPGMERTEAGIAKLLAAQTASRAAGPFLTTVDFFEPWMNPRRLFHHSWLLVGRSSVLERLVRFATSDEHLAGVLPGRGGVGKSRVLRALAESIEQAGSLTVRFVAEGQPVESTAFAVLPNDPLLLVVDDAHRRDDLDALLALARRRSGTKVLLSARGYGVDAIRAALGRVGFDVRESTVFDELQELDRDSTLALARQALGPNWEHHAEGLASATGDSPLVTAIGGKLIAEEALPPGLLAQHTEFREAVLTRLAGEYVRALGDQVDPIRARQILEVIAAAGPVRPKHEEFVEAAARFLGIDADELIRVLDTMERGGILLRRGGTLRITPDVLADFVLSRACLTSTGEPTGFAERVFDGFFPVTPGPVLTNLAEIDWQARQRRDHVDLLDEIWRRLEQEFHSSSNYHRKAILELLRDVALFQPHRTLQLIEYAITNPSDVEDPSPFRLVRSWSHEDVIHATPQLLRRIAYHPELRPHVLDLLWRLGPDDPRSLGQNPDHAVRILSELGSYDTNRLDMATAVLDRAERWAGDANTHGHAHSVLDVIDPMLEKAGSRVSTSGFHLNFAPYFVNPETTRDVRDRALALVRRYAHSDSTRVSLRGVKSLSNALRNAMGHFGSSPSDDLQARWLPEQLDVLEILGEFADNMRDPLVTIATIEALAWHACYGRDLLKARARSIIDGADQSFEFLLTKHLTGSYRFGILEFAEDDLEGGEEDQSLPDKWQRRGALQGEELDRLAGEFLTRFPSVDEGLAHLEARLRVIVEARDQVDPGQFLFRLAQTSPDYAERLCRAAAKSTYVRRSLSSVIGGMRSQSERAADRLMEELLTKDDDELTRIVAASCSQALWEAPPPRRPLEILVDLLQHPDEGTRWNAIQGLGILSTNDPKLALELGLKAEVGSSGRLADALFQALGQHGGDRFEHVREPATEALLAKLVPVDSIGEWSTARFLDHASRLAPVEVIRLILSRARHARGLINSEYRVMPYDFESSLPGFAEAPDRPGLLREIRDVSVTADEALEFWIPRLFAAITSGYAEDARIALNEWIDSGDAQKITAAAELIRPASADFVLTEADFVTNLIERAHAAGSECHKEVRGILLACACSRGGSGVAGEPMPHDVAARDRSAEIARSLPAGSAAREFYEMLRADAAASISRTMEYNAEIE